MYSASPKPVTECTYLVHSTLLILGQVERRHPQEFALTNRLQSLPTRCQLHSLYCLLHSRQRNCFNRLQSLSTSYRLYSFSLSSFASHQLITEITDLLPGAITVMPPFSTLVTEDRTGMADLPGGQLSHIGQ